VIADDVIEESTKFMDNSEEQQVVFPKIVASGNEKGMRLKPIVDKVVELSGSVCPKVIYIGTASFDRTDKFLLFTKAFSDMGCEIRRLDVSEDETTPSQDEMQELVVEFPDVIMCSGGNTLHALIRWKEVGLDLLIKEASMKGKVLCGGSAGAGCWFSSLHTDSLRPDNAKNKEHVKNDLTEEELADWDYAKISGLGFVDAMFVPHFDATGTNGIKRSEHAEMMMQRDPSTPAIGVEDNAALVIIGDEAHAVSGDGKATCHILVPDESTGDVKTAPLPTNWRAPIPIEEVLEFPEPAKGEHLEDLENYVDTDFVIADDVIEESTKFMDNSEEQQVVFPKIVASGNEKGMRLKPIVDKVVELSGSVCPKVIYIGTASFDRTDKFLLFTKAFSDMGCEIRRLDVSEDETTPSQDEMQELVVEFPDVIMCSGGNTLHALIRWKEVGLDLLIKEASMKGKVLCGGSAGAGCWFSSLHTDSLRPDNAKNKEHVKNDLTEEELADWDYAKISGLGFVDAMFVPHFDATGTNGIKRSEHAEMMMQRDPSTPAIGVEDNAALVIIGDEAHAVSGDGKATCHIVVLDENTGDITTKPLLTSQGSAPIKDILDLTEH